MVAREDLGSWLEGPAHDSDYVPGSSFGHTPAGPGRRFLTLWIDWIFCSVIAFLFFNYESVAIMTSFVALNIAMLTFFGATPGQFLLRVRVIPVSGRMPMLVRALLRTLLVLLVIPSVVFDRDRRNGQDLISGTATIVV
ncbi:RDD family protein [Dermabacteraceae bacterium TAE3-ERU27]|nr:RDD family protein [Dermabacteraceae bacterium TAE3-ERU27]